MKQSRCKVSLTASLGSTVAEEVIILICRLHTLPAWNQTINDYVTQQLSTVTDILLEDGLAEVRYEYVYEYSSFVMHIHWIKSSHFEFLVTCQQKFIRFWVELNLFY